MFRRIRLELYNIFDENDPGGHRLNRPVGLLIMALIILSVLAVILESDQHISDAYTKIFYNFEVFAVIVFTIEYLARLITADLKYKDVGMVRAVIAFVLSPMAIIDLLAIMPFYLEIALVAYGVSHMVDTRFLRVLRLMRLLRLFKLNRYNNSMKLIGNVLREEKEKLFITVFMVTILLILSAALIFTVEHEKQPDAFPNIYSSLWWAVATLTTVGYGDVYPVTGAGKVLSGLIALLGIGLVALPTGIMASSFVNHLNDQNAEDGEEEVEEEAKEEPDGTSFAFCPHCGKKLSEH